MTRTVTCEDLKMTESKFTPGPWRIGEYAVSDYCPTIYGPDGFAICTMEQGNINIADIVEADARLIEAAPAMFKSLNRLIPWIGRMIADGAHKNTVAPLDCENGLAEAEALIKKILGD
jgi:hypothetical protein